MEGGATHRHTHNVKPLESNHVCEFHASSDPGRANHPHVHGRLSWLRLMPSHIRARSCGVDERSPARVLSRANINFRGKLVSHIWRSARLAGVTACAQVPVSCHASILNINNLQL